VHLHSQMISPVSTCHKQNLPSSSSCLVLYPRDGDSTHLRTEYYTLYVQSLNMQHSEKLFWGMAFSSCYLQIYNCGSSSHLQELASHSPFGLNLTDDTALVCPASVNFNV
jgi:hypothetical protein